MDLGSIDRTPPPFFRQGYSARTKLVFFSALALFLMVADSRFEVAASLRAALATALRPLEQALLVPLELLQGGGAYMGGLNQALRSETQAREALARQSEQAFQATRLATENARLRALLELRPALAVHSRAAEILYEASDPYSRKVFIDRGAAAGVTLGSPVVNEAGVLGQVTRVYPLSAEVTLLTDRDAAIPVLNERTQQRGSAFGGAAQGAALELRFVAANADIKPGDALLTSGIDGVYPPGLPVARVLSVERMADAGFARVRLAPAASADGVRHVLVLEPLGRQYSQSLSETQGRAQSASTPARDALGVPGPALAQPLPASGANAGGPQASGASR
jgi:rod shape-determining protein MreC